MAIAFGFVFVAAAYFLFVAWCGVRTAPCVSDEEAADITAKYHKECGIPPAGMDW